MTELEFKAFKQLKKSVEQKFRLSFPDCNRDMENWTGQEILNFQEDLAEKVNGRISEKWFYTHIKNENQTKIPRIDILNLLSRYAGYNDWIDFKNKEFSNESSTDKRSSGIKRLYYLLGGIPVLTLLAILYILLKPIQKESKTYQLCFTDAYNGLPIVATPVEVLIAKDNESPVVGKSDTKGCITLEAEARMKLIIRARYYKTDTLVRFYKEQQQPEEIKLKPDDYALMIHIFSKSGIEDWKKRKAQMNEMIADDAKIFQVYKHQDLGMELYNKEEFIEKITMPLKSLRNIEILETEYKNNKIALIRFTQENEK
jgi:hypothetical protein